MTSQPNHSPSERLRRTPSPDGATPESCVLALYDVISGAADAPRDWDRFRALCRADARFVLATYGPDDAPLTRTIDVTTFAVEGAAAFAQRGLWERELVGRTERFGRVAHVFSSYETRMDSADAPVVARGVNSVQLVRDPDGAWQIAHLVWDRATPDSPLPPDLARA